MHIVVMQCNVTRNNKGAKLEVKVQVAESAARVLRSSSVRFLYTILV